MELITYVLEKLVSWNYWDEAADIATVLSFIAALIAAWIAYHAIKVSKRSDIQPDIDYEIDEPEDGKGYTEITIRLDRLEKQMYTIKRITLIGPVTSGKVTYQILQTFQPHKKECTVNVWEEMTEPYRIRLSKPSWFGIKKWFIQKDKFFFFKILKGKCTIFDKFRFADVNISVFSEKKINDPENKGITLKLRIPPRPKKWKNYKRSIKLKFFANKFPNNVTTKIEIINTKGKVF
ncbi:hypothetical protein [Stenoxybacter acetivorans]|uniref:hypothetical protein n=1 Tax=Stenoxybacter acetivorans TaxID=422441 RepID=UPI00055B34E2|nr:hypothetical protein [Stenoxybacter acetivorans]